MKYLLFLLVLVSLVSCVRKQGSYLEFTVWNESGDITQSNLNVWVECDGDTIVLNRYDWGLYTGKVWNDYITVHVEDSDGNVLRYPQDRVIQGNKLVDNLYFNNH